MLRPSEHIYYRLLVVDILTYGWKRYYDKNQKEPPKDDDEEEKPDDYDTAMEHVNDESDDAVFTSMKNSTEMSSPVNTKVTAVESKPDSGE